MNRVENDIYLRRWMAFDPRLTDEQVAECIYPYIPVEIYREENAVIRRRLLLRRVRR